MQGMRQAGSSEATAQLLFRMQFPSRHSDRAGLLLSRGVLEEQSHNRESPGFFASSLASCSAVARESDLP